jgi:hypothetical protein
MERSHPGASFAGSSAISTRCWIVPLRPTFATPSMPWSAGAIVPVASALSCACVVGPDAWSETTRGGSALMSSDWICGVDPEGSCTASTACVSAS